MSSPQFTLWILRGQSDFLDSDEKQDAVIRNIEVIGEAAKRVSLDTRARIPDVDWRAICGMRDVLIHNYVDVEIHEVWNCAFRDVPLLARELRRYLSIE
ncbi:MAG: DUF86 domain-containing protein [Acidobacteria bacterium]|nr:DUF86 domain-containing protein [Acidobacteriota bacterium]